MTGAAAVLAVLLAGCGSGPSDDEVRRRAADACRAHLAGLPPAPVTPTGARVAEGLLAHASQVNATDAALDAIGAGGAAGARVEGLRAGLSAMREGLVGVRYALIADDLAVIPVRATAARRGLAQADAAATALEVPECRAPGLGGPRVEALVDAAEGLRRAQEPTGDYGVDLGRACRLLPAPPGVAPRPRRGPVAQTRAIAVRQALRGFVQALSELRPPPARAEAHRAIIDDAERAQQLLFDYVNAVGVSDATGAEASADGVRDALIRIRARARDIGVACPAP